MVAFESVLLLPLHKVKPSQVGDSLYSMIIRQWQYYTYPEQNIRRGQWEKFLMSSCINVQTSVADWSEKACTEEITWVRTIRSGDWIGSPFSNQIKIIAKIYNL